MKVLEYLQRNGYKVTRKANYIFVSCPFCEEGEFAKYFSEKRKFKCFNCKTEFTEIEAMKVLYPDKSNYEIERMLADKPTIDLKLLDRYEQWGWDLVPIARKGKKPIEQGWVHKEHKNKVEWKKWLESGLNIGVKTGASSGITVIDIDGEIPDIFRPYLLKTLSQQTKKGYHLFFLYEPELRKTSFNLNNVHIDIQNDGGQVVIPPSIVEYDGELYSRSFLNISDPIPLPQELRKFILDQSKFKVQTFSEELAEHIYTENFNLKTIKEGEGRNNFLIHLGGLLRKKFPMQDVEFVLRLTNKHFCSPPLDDKELNHILENLQKYNNFDDQELAKKVYEYIKMVKECTKRDIKEAIREVGERLDRVLVYLIENDYIVRIGNIFKSKQKGEWKTEILSITKPIEFKMPYFHDIANFCWGDMILIASKSGFGKTTLAMNIIKRLVDQGIKPYYISLEAGSRFGETALKLGLKDGDFFWDFIPDPTKIELEENAITIIDWLLIRDKAKSDVIFEMLSNQIYKTNGILIVFQQLKENGDYFAPNLIQQFPAFATKFLYGNEEGKTDGYFKITKVRDPKIQFYPKELPTVYNWETREIKRLDEVIEQGDGEL